MNTKNLYAVILAGGSGTRFWPMSRRANPKQFLQIADNETLFEKTLKRLETHVKAKNIFIVTGQTFVKPITKQIRSFNIPFKNVLLEPQGKNTAPAICWAATKIHETNPQAVMMVLPSDHLILNEKKFWQCLDRAVSLAERKYLVTLGIVPTRAETGYGYLKTVKEGKIVRVKKFTEKPSLVKAQEFIKTKKYLWNSGMFIWKTSQILKEFERHLPKVCDPLMKGLKVETVWQRFPSISVDYAILEKANNVVTVPASNIGWSDLGSWESLADILSKDKNGNIFKGDILSLNSQNNFVWGQTRLMSVIGVEGLCIIDTKDALLVCHKGDSQQVKDMVFLLSKNNRKEV